VRALVPVVIGLATILFARHLRNEVLSATSVAIQHPVHVPVQTPLIVPQPGLVNGVPAVDWQGRRPAAPAGDPSDADPAADAPAPAPAVGVPYRNTNRYPRRPGGSPPVHPAERLLNQSTGGPAEARVP